MGKKINACLLTLKVFKTSRPKCVCVCVCLFECVKRKRHNSVFKFMFWMRGTFSFLNCINIVQLLVRSLSMLIRLFKCYRSHCSPRGLWFACVMSMSRLRAFQTKRICLRCSSSKRSARVNLGVVQDGHTWACAFESPFISALLG